MPSSSAPKRLRLVLVIGVAMMAFAANSLLGRAALVRPEIDPASFAAIRIVSGAAMLLLLTRGLRRQKPTGNWGSGLWLAIYAIPFSYAYVSLSTGTGALILFGCVQATMIGAGVLAGERPSLVKWFGIVTAATGLVLLVLPGVSAPEPLGAALMACSGVGWGVYSLRGKRAQRPLPETAGNFLRATLPSVAVCGIAALLVEPQRPTSQGVALAATSGALTSGIGYALWYWALPHIKATTAAIVQLTVPVLAALFGLIALNETASLRLIGSSILILGGVALAIVKRR